MSDDAKTRSEIDKFLSKEEQEIFFAVVERGTLAEAALWLQKMHDIRLSPTAIGKWAAKQRRKADDFRFSCWLS